ncbi:nucleotide pyrophosphohydrolase [Kitasatospora sp. NPDC058965]|uniref:nucleotide pyrophosphohydrolase n=1 Tax=Kitasatospora sp. NPDC058965 TaxID=3346682 RepID=UPI0036C3204F
MTGGAVAAGGAPTVAALSARLAEFAAVRGWQPFHNPKNLAAALSVEAGELLEIFQWLTQEQAAAVMAHPERAERVRDEVADVLAYLLQFCLAVGVDPLAALAAKIDRNEQRFPAP